MASFPVPSDSEIAKVRKERPWIASVRCSRSTAACQIPF